MAGVDSPPPFFCRFEPGFARIRINGQRCSRWSLDRSSSVGGLADTALEQRLADYALNREFLVTAGDLVPFTGVLSAYERQPIEADAKRFRASAVDGFLGGVNK